MALELEKQLLKACEEGRLDEVRRLVDEQGVDLSCRDKHGDTPLHLACGFGRTEIVRFLTIDKQCDTECRTNTQNTPLHYAAFVGHLDIVKLLIDDVHCDPTVKGQYGRTPLHYACIKGHLDITKYLVDEVHVDPMCKDDDLGSTPLHLASDLGHTHIVRFLTIERQINAECRTNTQNTPLHSAAFGGRLDIVKLLIDEVHCDPTVKGQYGRTPLHDACQEGHLDIAKYLIDKQHADPLYQDMNNVIPLHMGALGGHTEVVKYLVGDKKCDPRPKTKQGETPYDWARDEGHMDVALYLRSQGGGPSLPSTISPTHPTGSQKMGGALSLQEYKTVVAHSQQTQLSLTQALAKKKLQFTSLRPAKMVHLQATLEQQGAQLHKERGQREEAEKQLKTNQKELHDMQQKVDELQEEKEKLEGQLQSAQDSIKDIQEQLTSPEKSDQAIQTHREPSYLQISAQMLDKEREFQVTLEQRETQLDWERRRREEVEQQFKRKLNEMQLQLQEREKLAGQLKRKVDEMQLQINELREREKLAGQSTGEAALTTKEIQEQLTPPENQSVQAYTEPPLLQTSEATQATGEAAITTKEIQEQLPPPEKSDKTYTEPPLLQTSEVFQLRGVHVVGETTFTATRHSTTLNWEEYGFMLHISEGALPPDVDQCHIHVKATIRGQFQLPNDHELISAVFWIRCHHKLSKPATIEIEHCAAITTDKQCSALTFVRTQCNQEKLPYTFKPVPEGVFTPGSCLGSLSLSRFSGYGIAYRKRPRRKSHRSAKKPKLSEVFSGHATEDDDDLFVQERYCAQLYSTNKGVNVWKVYFVLTMDLKADMKAVEKHFSGVANLEIEPFEVMLEEDEITLDIPEDGVHTKEGWMIYPSYSPIITKNRVKYFDRRGRSLPMCELVVKWQDDEEKPSWLAYRVRIKGVCASRNFFWLTINPTSEIGQRSSQDTVRSHDALPQVSVKPELKDLVLIPVSSWYKLGLRLDISDVDLDCIRDSYKDGETCKIEMFKLWLKKNPSSSYEQLVKALTAIGEKTMADKLCQEIWVSH